MPIIMKILIFIVVRVAVVRTQKLVTGGNKNI